MSTDAENTRLIIDAAKRIEQLILQSDEKRRTEIERIRNAMNVDAELELRRSARNQNVRTDHTNGR